MAQHGFNIVASIIFLCAIIHTFIVGVFKELAHLHEARHKDWIVKERRRAEDKPHVDAKDDVSFRATLYHLLGEIEVVLLVGPRAPATQHSRPGSASIAA